MICHFCGMQVGDNERICKYCGSALLVVNASQKDAFAKTVTSADAIDSTSRKIDGLGEERKFESQKIQSGVDVERYAKNVLSVDRADDIQDDLSGVTIVMPSIKTSDYGFESSKEVETRVKSETISHRRAVNKEKKKYYRYNPNQHKKKTVHKREMRQDQEPPYISDQLERKEKRKTRPKLMKMIGKFLMLALIGFTIGFIIYYVAINVSSMIN